MNNPGMMQVIENKEIAEKIFCLRMQAEAGQALFFRPGTFLNITVPNRKDLILRRPISIADYDDRTGVVALIYQVRGKGTEALSCYEQGEIDVLGPLGNGFSVPTEATKCLVIGGGLGCAPVYALAKANPKISFDAVLGFRNKEAAFLTDEYHRYYDRVVITSEDGSMGQKGFVTDVLKNLDQYDAVFVCGPGALYKAIKPLMNGIRCYISLEERMGCGMGACVACACAIETDGEIHHKRVCKDGPVFLLNEVVL